MTDDANDYRENHQMKLKQHPFNMIWSGQIIFDLRIYDEKRQNFHS